MAKTLIKCGKLFDGDRVWDSPTAVVLNGEIIERVIPWSGDLATALEAEGARVLDAGDWFVMPGLIDLHVHLGYWYTRPEARSFQDSPQSIALLAYHHATSALKGGVTTVRDVGSPLGVALSVKHAVDSGLLAGPRIFAAGRLVCMTGGHGSGLPGIAREADGVQEIRKAVREQARLGADLIKITTSHPDQYPEYSQEELDAAVDESHRLGKRIACHATMMPAVKMAVDAGFDTIEHGLFMTPEVIKKAAETGITWVPTMYVYQLIASRIRSDLKAAGSPDSVSFWLNCDKVAPHTFAGAIEAGLRIASGTDIIFPDVEFSPVADELGVMVDRGMSPLAALRAATSVAAAALGWSEKIGSIKEGALADLIAVAGNPVADVRVLKSVKFSMKGGKLLWTAECVECSPLVGS
jgi:imidazolonepropionase-like amidohydrolase